MSRTQLIPEAARVHVLPALTWSNLGTGGAVELRQDFHLEEGGNEPVDTFLQARVQIGDAGHHGQSAVGLAAVQRTNSESSAAGSVRASLALPVMYRRQLIQDGPAYATMGMSTSLEYVTNSGIGLGGGIEMFGGLRISGDGPVVMNGGSVSLSLSYGHR